MQGQFEVSVRVINSVIVPFVQALFLLHVSHYEWQGLPIQCIQFVQPLFMGFPYRVFRTPLDHLGKHSLVAAQRKLD